MDSNGVFIDNYIYNYPPPLYAFAYCCLGGEGCIRGQQRAFRARVAWNGQRWSKGMAHLLSEHMEKHF